MRSRGSCKGVFELSFFGRRPWGGHRSCWRDHIFCLTHKHFSILPGQFGASAYSRGARGCLGYFTETAVLVNVTWITRGRWRPCDVCFINNFLLILCQNAYSAPEKVHNMTTVSISQVCLPELLMIPDAEKQTTVLFSFCGLDDDFSRGSVHIHDPTWQRHLLSLCVSLSDIYCCLPFDFPAFSVSFYCTDIIWEREQMPPPTPSLCITPASLCATVQFLIVLTQRILMTNLITG